MVVEPPPSMFSAWTAPRDSMRSASSGRSTPVLYPVVLAKFCVQRVENGSCHTSVTAASISATELTRISTSAGARSVRRLHGRRPAGGEET